MPGYSRRILFDLNQCQFQGRVTDTPILEKYTRKDGVETDVVRFQVVCNSNPFSKLQATYFRCYAYGIKAQKIAAMVKKGYTVMCITEAKSVTIKADKKKGTPSYQFNEFEVKWCYIVAIPSGEHPEVEPRTNTKAMFTLRDIKSIMVNVTEAEVEYANAIYEDPDPKEDEGP